MTPLFHELTHISAGDKATLIDLFEDHPARPTRREGLFSANRVPSVSPEEFVRLIEQRLAVEYCNSLEGAKPVKPFPDLFGDWISEETHYTLERNLGLKWDFENGIFVPELPNFRGLYDYVRSNTVCSAGSRAILLFSRYGYNAEWPRDYAKQNLRASLSGNLRDIL